MNGITLRGIEEQWRERSYAIVPCVVSPQDIQVAVLAFQRFLSLPEEAKTSVHAQLYAGDRGSHIGYRRREPAEGAVDRKVYFHFNRYACDAFPDPQHNFVASLLDRAWALYEPLEAQARLLVSLFAERQPDILEQFFPRGQHPACTLRFLQYDAQPPGKFLATGHTDRSSFTIALAESKPGLRIGTSPSDLRPVRRNPGEGVFFAGERLKQSLGHRYVPAWHDVADEPDETNHEPRWAIILFFSPPGPNEMTFEENHRYAAA